jgi:Holliday junction resolvase-like predicted endonuclease
LLIFTEVKTKGSKKFGRPSDAIDKKKIALYKDAVEGYLEQCPSEDEIRFDVVNIIIGKDETKIEYIPNAF